MLAILPISVTVSTYYDNTKLNYIEIVDWLAKRSVEILAKVAHAIARVLADALAHALRANDECERLQRKGELERVEKLEEEAKRTRSRWARKKARGKQRRARREWRRRACTSSYTSPFETKPTGSGAGQMRLIELKFFYFGADRRGLPGHLQHGLPVRLALGQSSVKKQHS